mgnify:FL=1|jgi:hypothetical protein
MPLNNKYTFKIASLRTPKITSKTLSGALRYEVVQELCGNKNIGIELGVAKGNFSKHMVESKKFKLFFGVDSYSDFHDVSEYKEAIQNIGLEKPYKLLRMPFDEALDLFEDDYFDFIYIDGFAHTGEEGGKTLCDWYKKLKIGGVISGDDYHADWPLVIWAVNHFTAQTGGILKLTEKTETIGYSLYPSWYIKKENIKLPKPDPELVIIANKERQRIHRKRFGVLRNVERLLSRLLKKHGWRHPIKRLTGKFIKYKPPLK